MRNPLPLLIALVAAPPVWGQSDAPSALTFWNTLNDTTLLRLVEQTLRANHDVRAAEARIREARATRTAATLELIPRVTATGDFSRQRLSTVGFPATPGGFPDQSVWGAGVQLQWEVDVFGRLRRSLQGRGDLLESAEHDAADVEVLLAAEMANTYFDLRGAVDRLAVARRNAENQRNTLQLTRDRLEAGTGTALDSERAQAQLSSTLADIPLLETQVAAAHHRIAVLLGRSPASVAADLVMAPQSVTLPEKVTVDDLEAVIRRRPDVRRAHSDLAARTAFVGAAQAEYLPRISISGVAGYTATQFDALGGSGTGRYAFGPVITWPLFDLGSVKAGVDAARAGEAAAEARYDQTTLRATEEAETALTGYHNARERLQHLEDAAAASARATDLARLRFAEGGTDFLEVLDAERRQLEAQDRLSAGRTDASEWLVAVYKALGGFSLTVGR